MPAYTFQHIKDGSDVDGETDAAYVIPSVVEADSGSYRVRVTNTNGGLVRTFGPKGINVIPAPPAEGIGEAVIGSSFIIG